jgi:DNA helicase II / ATP-dependent DNA helicase PcrA
VNLNPEQNAAIAAGPGAWNIMACAGSGKTEVLTRRIERLLNEGASLDEILAVTFTKEAAENLCRRLKLKPDKTGRGGFRTFHSFCLNLVRKEARFLPYGLSSDPFPAGDAISKLLRTAMKKNNAPRKEFEAVRAYISQRKRQRVLPDGLASDIDNLYAQVYKEYEKLLHDGGMLDFDSMIVEAVNMLEKYLEVRERWQFCWVLCDEAQDTDDLQFRLLQLVSEKYGNVFVVGDFCQALYEFRGASPNNLIHFVNWFPNAKTLILPENYRSSQEVCNFSRLNAPVDNDLTRAIRTSNPNGPAIEFRMYPGATEEAEAVLAAASADPGNSAILARTNQQLGLFETLCLAHSIRFHLLGRSGLWNKPEISTLVGLATYCLGNKQPSRYSETLLFPHRISVRTKPPHQGLREVVRYANLENLYANDDFDNDENFALSNINTVVDIAKRFHTLPEFLNHARKAAHASRKSKNAVTLGTIHASKGLEFTNVFVVGVQEGLLPHTKGDLQEEKRIFYVAITRPKKRLRISFSGSPSSFLEPHLTPEIQTELQKHASQVEKLQRQQELFAK